MTGDQALSSNVRCLIIRPRPTKGKRCITISCTIQVCFCLGFRAWTRRSRDMNIAIASLQVADSLKRSGTGVVPSYPQRTLWKLSAKGLSKFEWNKQWKHSYISYLIFVDLRSIQCFSTRLARQQERSTYG